MASLTLWQKLHFPLGLINAILGTAWITIAAPFRGSNTPTSLTRYLKLAITRRVLSRFYPEQLQAVAGTTESNYYAWIKGSQQTPHSVELTSIGTKAFWIGRPDAANTVLYFHGGGFAMPGANGHFILTSSLVESAKRSGKDTAVLMLQYDLAPGTKYPRQLFQAVELLRYNIEVLRKSPNNIMLMGDSAGGNMIFGVLSHLMHPLPATSTLRLDRPIRSAVICSPVTVLNTANERFRTHEGQDPASGRG